MVKRLKGRHLGTAYGEREHQIARHDRIGANIETSIGLAQTLGGAALMATGHFVSGGIAVATAPNGAKRRAVARREAAHGTAVESLIAKSRGGSAALGQHGIVPKRRVGPQSALTPDDMAKFAHASHQFAASKNVASAQPATPATTGKPRGWSNKARIASAQARGVQMLPYGGNSDEDA